MSETHCKDCRHFVQHYGLNERKLYRLYCGHCMKEKSRRRRPDNHACCAFEPGPSDEEVFASKEYLSKALLQYVLGLELLPEIEEA